MSRQGRYHAPTHLSAKLHKIEESVYSFDFSEPYLPLQSRLAVYLDSEYGIKSVNSNLATIFFKPSSVQCCQLAAHLLNYTGSGTRAISGHIARTLIERTVSDSDGSLSSEAGSAGVINRLIVYSTLLAKLIFRELIVNHIDLHAETAPSVFKSMRILDSDKVPVSLVVQAFFPCYSRLKDIPFKSLAHPFAQDSAFLPVRVSDGLKGKDRFSEMVAADKEQMLTLLRLWFQKQTPLQALERAGVDMSGRDVLCPVEMVKELMVFLCNFKLYSDNFYCALLANMERRRRMGCSPSDACQIITTDVIKCLLAAFDLKDVVGENILIDAKLRIAFMRLYPSMSNRMKRVELLVQHAHRTAVAVQLICLKEKISTVEKSVWQVAAQTFFNIGPLSVKVLNFLCQPRPKEKFNVLSDYSRYILTAPS